MSVSIAILPVAGRGTRLLPLTKSQPKEMLPVGRKPVVQWVIEELARCGVNRLLFVTGPGKTAIENHFDIDVELIDHLRHTGKEDLLEELAFERQDIDFLYTRQRRQLGLGHAVLCGRPMVGDQPFVVALGDSFIGPTGDSRIVERMIDCFDGEGADAVIAFEEVPAADVVHYGIAQPAGSSDGSHFVLSDVVEKPTVATAPSNLAIAGRYVCSAKLFDYLENTAPGQGGEIQFTDALRACIRDGGKVLGVRLLPGERRFDVGNFGSYFQAFLEMALRDPEYGEQVCSQIKGLLDGPRND